MEKLDLLLKGQNQWKFCARSELLIIFPLTEFTSIAMHVLETIK